MELNEGATAEYLVAVEEAQGCAGRDPESVGESGITPISKLLEGIMPGKQLQLLFSCAPHMKLLLWL